MDETGEEGRHPSAPSEPSQHSITLEDVGATDSGPFSPVTQVPLQNEQAVGAVGLGSSDSATQAHRLEEDAVAGQSPPRSEHPADERGYESSSTLDSHFDDDDEPTRLVWEERAASEASSTSTNSLLTPLEAGRVSNTVPDERYDGSDDQRVQDQDERRTSSRTAPQNVAEPGTGMDSDRATHVAHSLTRSSRLTQRTTSRMSTGVVRGSIGAEQASEPPDDIHPTFTLIVEDDQGTETPPRRPLMATELCNIVDCYGRTSTTVFPRASTHQPGQFPPVESVWTDPVAFELREELRVGVQSQQPANWGPTVRSEEPPPSVRHDTIPIPLHLYNPVKRSVSCIVLPTVSRLLRKQAESRRFGPSVEPCEEEGSRAEEDDHGAGRVHRASITITHDLPEVSDEEEGKAVADAVNGEASPRRSSSYWEGSEDGSRRESKDISAGIRAGTQTSARGSEVMRTEEVLEDIIEEGTEAAVQTSQASCTGAVQLALSSRQSEAPCFTGSGVRDSIHTPELSVGLQGAARYFVKEYAVVLRAGATTEGSQDEVTVEFHTAQGKHFRKMYKTYANMLELKEDIASFFCSSVKHIDLLTEGLHVQDSLPLAGLDLDAQEVELTIRVTQLAKPYLGGLRDSRTGLEYYHAESQTGPRPRDSTAVSRVTQTVRTRRRRVRAQVDKATQVPRPDLYIPGLGDRVVTGSALRYVTSERAELALELDRQVRVIQKNFRAYLLRRLLRGLHEERQERARTEEAAQALEAGDRRRSDTSMQPSAYPTSRQDFLLLYNLVEKWRRAETDRIARTNSEAAKRAKLCEVLDKEVELIRAIDKHRQKVATDRRRTTNEHFLKKCAQPLVLADDKGREVTVETMEITRAKEMYALFCSVTAADQSVAERMSLLVQLNEGLHDVHLPTARTLQALLAREYSLLHRGAPPATLVHLRERITLLFGDLARRPEINPEAYRHSLPAKVSRMRGFLACAVCKNFFPMEGFPLHSRSRRIWSCERCARLHNVAVPREADKFVRNLMQAVRRDEQRRRAYSSVAFIMQLADFKTLLGLWLGRSVLTEDTTSLRMPRWLSLEEWSPWNCVLLTHDEAVAHTSLEPPADPAALYAPALVSTVQQRHLQARRVFSRLRVSERVLRASSHPVDLGLTEEIAVP